MYVCVTMNVMCKLSINHHCKNLLLEPYSAPNQQDKKEAEDKKKKKNLTVLARNKGNKP